MPAPERPAEDSRWAQVPCGCCLPSLPLRAPTSALPPNSSWALTQDRTCQSGMGGQVEGRKMEAWMDRGTGRRMDEWGMRTGGDGEGWVGEWMGDGWEVGGGQGGGWVEGVGGG